MMTLLDLTSYVDFYLWGITNLVVFLQWAQVYRVITNPEDASETLAHNWAVKMQCTFIIYFTIMIIASMYFGAWAHTDQTKLWLRNMKLALQICNLFTQVFLIGIYSILLMYFKRLIDT